MQPAITSAIITIASIISVVGVVNATLPEVNKTSSAMSASNRSAVDRLRTDVVVVYAAGNTVTDTITLWLKNTGSLPIYDIESSDLILNTASGANRLPFQSGAENWVYQIEDGEETWKPVGTVKITIKLTDVASGVYQLRFGLPNGVAVTTDISM